MGKRYRMRGIPGVGRENSPCDSAKASCSFMTVQQDLFIYKKRVEFVRNSLLNSFAKDKKKEKEP